MEDGRSSQKDVPTPVYKKETFPLSDTSAEPKSLLITYAGLDEKSVYYLGNGAASPVVVTYDCLTVYAEKVFWDKRTLHLHAEGEVVVEDGMQRRVAEQGDVTFENGKAVVRLP